MPKASNATASAFGWEFQSNAAIMLMLKNIENTSKVKVEGENKDVKITFSNGKMPMAQAKSVMNSDGASFDIDKLEVVLKTLIRLLKLPMLSCLFMFQICRTLSAMYKFSSPLNMVPFFDPLTNCQWAIGDICSTNGYSIDRLSEVVVTISVTTKINSSLLRYTEKSIIIQTKRAKLENCFAS